MKLIFEPGDKKYYTKIVGKEDTATFDSGTVHPVYATFALGRDAEWACRLFVLEMKDENEEGIGTFLQIQHQSPAIIGQEVVFEAEVELMDKNELICKFTASVGSRMIASGKTGQKIILKEKLEKLFQSL
jgi:fluoroacetyl-CoA thioesterase